MQTFSAPPIPADAPEWFRQYARALELAIKQAANQGNDSVALRYLSTGPARPQDGNVYALAADNTNASSGKGMYRYSFDSSALTGTFTFLG